MSGGRLLVDTNIALYLLSGDKTIAEFLDQKDVYVSFITELELLGYPELSQTDAKKIKAFLDQCRIVELNEQIKETVIELKRQRRLKLPDAIIAATGIYLEVPLFSADSAFSLIEGMNFIHYVVPSKEE